MCPEFVPGGIACRFVLVPGEVHHRRHDRTGQYLSVANGVDADLVEDIYFIFIEHRDFPLVGLFVGTVVRPKFEQRPALVRHQKGSVHGDNPKALEFVKNIRETLVAEGVEIKNLFR